MGDPAILYGWSESSGLIGDVEPCRVRVHENFNELGDQKGTNFHYAETAENSPKAIFLAEEVIPKRNLFFRTQEAVYRIDSVDPIDDITYTAYIVRYDGDISAMPEPESDD